MVNNKTEGRTEGEQEQWETRRAVIAHLGLFRGHSLRVGYSHESFFADCAGKSLDEQYWLTV